MNNHIADLKGRCLVVLETDENRRFSAAKIKSLTGGESIGARMPRSKEVVTFKPTHKLFLCTGRLPKASELTSFRSLASQVIFPPYHRYPSVCCQSGSEDSE